MGNIEKYGVVALLFVIVMVLAVSIWGPRSVDENQFDSATLSAPTDGALMSSNSPQIQEENAGDAAATARRLDAQNPATLPIAHDDSITGTENPVTQARPIPAEASFTEETIRYKVKNGDTLEEIAAKHLGSKSKWKEILKWNEGLNPARLKVGQEIVIHPSVRESRVAQEAPSARAQEIQTSVAFSEKKYKVTKGDSLYDIAKKVYGDGNQWKKIFDANRDKLRDPGMLSDGMELKLP